MGIVITSVRSSGNVGIAFEARMVELPPTRIGAAVFVRSVRRTACTGSDGSGGGSGSGKSSFRRGSYKAFGFIEDESRESVEVALAAQTTATATTTSTHVVKLGNGKDESLIKPASRQAHASWAHEYGNTSLPSEPIVVYDT